MWVDAVNALAGILALVNFCIGTGGELRWIWLSASICFAFIAVWEHRKISKKE